MRQRGPDHHMTLLSEAEVETIYVSTDSVRVLARRMNISTTTIFNIKHKIAWSHLTDKLDKEDVTTDDLGQTPTVL